jgi:hypothetical protein
MYEPDDDWQWQQELELYEQHELQEQEKCHEHSNAGYRTKRDRKEHFASQSGPFADPFDSGR